MAFITGKCAKCNQEVSKQVGENVFERRLRWHVSSECNNCGFATIEDGSDVLPPDLRQAILEQNGSWNLTVSASGPEKIQALKILRETLGWTVAEVSLFSKSIPGIVATGTQAEMVRLKELLAADGLESIVSKN